MASSYRRRLVRKRKAIAFHEAAHAVARLHVGAVATAVEIRGTRFGYTHGTPNRWPGRGEHRMWKWLLCLFAGSYAEAFVMRRSLVRTMFTSGKRDFEYAEPAIRWLVAHGYAAKSLEVLTRNHVATCAFLAMRWDAIERVAQELSRRGRLTGRQVRKLASTPP